MPLALMGQSQVVAAAPSTPACFQAPGTPATVQAAQHERHASLPKAGSHYIIWWNGSKTIAKFQWTSGDQCGITLLSGTSSGQSGGRYVQIDEEIKVPIRDLKIQSDAFAVKGGHPPKDIRDRLRAQEFPVDTPLPCLESPAPMATQPFDMSALRIAEILPQGQRRFKYVSQLKQLRSMGFNQAEDVLKQALTTVLGDIPLLMSMSNGVVPGAPARVAAS